MTYRIADEVAPGIPAEPGLKAPWHPLGLFTLLVLLPTFVPFGAVFGALNWARLGHPERRVMWLAMGLFVFFVPFLLAATPVATEYFVMTAALMTRLGYAYALLTSQRPLYDAYLARNGRTAAVWPLWVSGAVALLIIFALPYFMPADSTPQRGQKSPFKPSMTR